MWGADYPHLEGAVPVHREVLRHVFGGLPEPDVRAMLGENAMALWDFDRAALRAAADRVGPTVAEVADPDRPRRLPGDLQLEPGSPGAADCPCRRPVIVTPLAARPVPSMVRHT